MGKALVEVEAGICGFATRVEAWSNDGGRVAVRIESDCANIQSLSDDLQELDPFSVVLGSAKDAPVLAVAARHPVHQACPVPIGVLKAVEVAAGLALPSDVVIKVRRGD